MAIITALIELILNLDKYLDIILQNYGALIYLILFAVIFAETGFVITPFLPGDSLLFISGALFASKGIIELFLLFFILAGAAILGDSFNYWIGKYIGKKISSNSRFIKKEYMQRTHQFYARHGGKTIILARFVPIIRTFAPFIAGIGRMNYLRFISFNIMGGILWVGTFVFGGYYLGRVEFIKENLSLFILLIIFISFIPIIIEYFRNQSAKH